MINFTHLYAFYAVAKAGSVSAGAEKIRVSQPAVTREIRELEERHGLRLFDRLPRGVTLTEAGQFLFGYAEKIFSLADAAEMQLRELSGISSGLVRIGASTTLGVYLVPDLISRFNIRFPKVGIDFMVSNTAEVEAGLRAHAFTLGFVEGPFDDSTFNARLIGSDEIAVVAAPAHVWAGSVLEARDLLFKTVILREIGSGTRAMVEAAYLEKGLVIDPLMSVSDTEAIKRVLLARQAMAYVSLLSVKNEIDRGELVVVDVEGLHIERPLHLVWLKGRSLSPSSQAFLDMVEAFESIEAIVA